MHPSDSQLDALARGEGPAELAAHAQACERCGPVLRERRAVLGLLRELPEVEPSELEWKRVDRHVMEALDREQASRAGRRSVWVIAVPALAAAAACAVVGTKLVSMANHPDAPRIAPAQAAVALAMGGDAHTGRGGPELLEGDALDAAGGSIEVQTAPATGIALTAGAQARATRLRVGETEFTLSQGELLAEVKPLARGASFAVKAGDLTVHVVGTAFQVERLQGKVRVAVVHGRVRVDRAGQPNDELYVPGGSEALIPDGAVLGQVALTPIAGELAARFPLAFPDLQPDEVERQFGQAEIESEPAGATARLDGASRGVTPLTVLAPEGTHEVELNMPGHLPQKHPLKVSRTRAQATLALPAAVPVEEVAPEPPAPTPVPAPLPPPKGKPTTHAAAAPAPTVAPQVSYAEAFHTAAKSHQDEVEACYKKLDLPLARRIHVVLTIQPTGNVAPPVQVEEPGVDPAFVDCVNGAARGWSFPAPGRQYEVSIPYDLAPTR
ncbi:MAG: FecR domain-containing protein [Deltaproteobacteria bacterium]|nr:FecR domain-containing protein [Deltaproteobacteria bacterium]